MPAEKEAVRRWMRDVMERKEWSAERWARLSETSPTNITRFLREMDLHGDSEFLPSSRTIAKLARTAGSQPVFSQQLSRLSQVQDVPMVADLLWLIGGTPLTRPGRNRACRAACGGGQPAAAASRLKPLPLHGSFWPQAGTRN